MIRKLTLIALVLLSAVLMSGCTQTAVQPTPTPTPAMTTPAATTIATTVPPTTPAPKTIMDIARADSNFTTLVTAIDAANLSSTLSGPGPFTVFAPTNAAFGKLSNNTLQTLLAQPQGQLKQILLYHVVSGKINASAVMNATVLKTLQGGNLTVNVTNKTVMVDGAKVIITDIQASNGVVHVIDTVMIPP